MSEEGFSNSGDGERSCISQDIIRETVKEQWLPTVLVFANHMVKFNITFANIAKPNEELLKLPVPGYVQATIRGIQHLG